MCGKFAHQRRDVATLGRSTVGPNVRVSDGCSKCDDSGSSPKTSSLSGRISKEVAKHQQSVAIYVEVHQIS